MADNFLGISVTLADGSVYRWGPDEPGAEDIPDDLSFSTSVPGGFKDLTCSLLRRIDLAYPDEALFADVRVYGAGNQTLWEGRIAQLPRSHGDSYGVTPGAVGYSAHLSDDPSFVEVYVDRDMTRWTTSTLPRRRAVAVAGFPQGKMPVTIGDGGISWLPPNEALPVEERTEVMYDIGVASNIARIEYRGQRTGAFTSFETPTVFVGNSESGPTTSSEVLTLDNTMRVATAFTDGRYAMLRARTTAGVTPAAGYEQSYDMLAVYGDHGVPVHLQSADFSGVYASEVIADIIDRAAPMLATDGINATDFVIPHLAFRDPVTPASAIQLINGYHGWDWAVWENRTFYYTEPDPDRLCWEARLSDGARLDLEGDTAEQIFNGVVVVFTDGTGKQYMVGPPGADTDYTDAALADTSLENPVNANGIPRRWEILPLSEPTTLLGATTLGTVWLAQHSLPQRRGTLTLTSTVIHPTKGPRPVYEVRAGDYVRISDHSSSVARKIIEQSYTHGSQTNTLTLDNTPGKLEALLERLAVGRIGRY